MVLHWLTTGWRSLISNPLFSLITIISLSVGAAGALLVGANVKQHLSFDRWVPDSEHVFLVTRHQDINKMFAGATMRIEGGNLNRPQSASPAKLAEAIEGQIPGIVATARMFRGAPLLPVDPTLPTGPPLPGEPPRTPPPGSVYVDPSFFEMFGLEFIEGSVAGLEEPSGIIITETAARRLFGKEPAMGQTVEGAAKRQFRVVGVLRDLPVTTHLRFEALGNVRMLQQINEADRASQPPVPGVAPPGFTPSTFDNWTRGSNAALYIRTDTATDPRTFVENARQTIQQVADDRSKQNVAAVPAGMPGPMPQNSWTYNVVPLTDIHLGGPELTGIASNADVTMLSTLTAAGIALLVVSAFNYVTLSLARSLRRRREVAVRKVLGADQGALVRHYLSESAIVTAMSLVIGFLLAQLLHPWFARTIGQPETMFDLFDPVFLTGALVVFAVLALAVGAYPAFYLANTRPRTALGEGGAAAPGRVGQMVTGGLMGLQISAATGLLIISLTMAAQSHFIETRSLGYETRDRYQVQIPCFPGERATAAEVQSAMKRCQTAARQMLTQSPDLPKAAYFNGALVTDNVFLEDFGRAAKGEKLGQSAQMSVDADFLQMMGAKLLAGRFFDSASAYDNALRDYSTAMQARMRTTVQTDGGGRTMIFQSYDETSGSPPKRPDRVPVIVTRSMLAPLGADTAEKAIGMQFYQQPYGQYPFEVIGVVEDWNQRPLKYAVTPLYFSPAGGQGAIIQVAENEVDQVRERLNAAWKTLSQGTTQSATQVSLRPLQQTLETTYRADFLLMGAVTSFALVAIAVAGLGVFGLSSFEMRRRVREIGIRKALGASPYGVAALVIGRALVFAGIACLIAWPIGFYIANEWLSGFVYRTNLGWAVLPLSSLAVIAFVGVAVSFSALRAAAVRPGLALRV